MDPPGVQGSGPPAIPVQHLQGSPQRLRRDAPRLIDPLADAGDHHVAGQVVQLGVSRGEPRHQEADGVRSEVDGGHAIAGLLVVTGLAPLQAPGHPPPDGVGATGDVVRVVRVQAFDPSGRPADPAPLLGARVEPPPFLGVLLVGSPQCHPKVRVGLCPLFYAVDPSLRLEARHGLDRLRARQPVKGGKGVALGIQRPVPDH